MKRRSVFRGAAALGGAAMLGACGQEGDSRRRTGPGGITVTDQRGKTVTLDRPARRIVTLPKPAAAMLVAIDGTSEHLVGMNQASWAAIKDGILGQIFPKALQLPHDVAGDDFAPNVESILALEPDLVVQWGDHGREIITPLEKVGLDVLGLSYGTQEDLTTWIELFAKVLGKPQRSRDLLTRFDTSMSDIRSSTANRSRSRPKVLYFIQFSGLEVAGKGTYNDWYVELVGATNPASSLGSKATQGFVRVDREQILAWDPDIILLGKNDDAVPGDVYGDQVWEGVSAVRSGRVYRVPLGGYPWDAPCQESPLMWRWLADVAFPKQRSTLRHEISTYYRFLYGQEPTSTQIDTILRTDVNGGSADYGQFGAA